MAVADRHAAGGALQRTTRQLTALIESLATGVLLVDEHGRVAYTNHAYCEMFGLGDPNELVGTLRTDLWPSVCVHFPDPASALGTFWLVTAYATDAHIARGLEHGAVDYVVKPFRRDDLLARIDAALTTSPSAPPPPGGAPRSPRS